MSFTKIDTPPPEGGGFFSASTCSAGFRQAYSQSTGVVSGCRSATILRPLGESKFLPGGILVLILVVTFERFVVSPAITVRAFTRTRFGGAGRRIGGAPSYWVLPTSYPAIEGVKWLLMIVLAGRMVFSQKGSGLSRNSRRQFDQVNKPNYSRVNW